MKFAKFAGRKLIIIVKSSLSSATAYTLFIFSDSMTQADKKFCHHVSMYINDTLFINRYILLLYTVIINIARRAKNITYVIII